MNPVGQRARKLYKDKIKQGEGDLVRKGISRLVKVERGKPVPVTFPVFNNPRVNYGPRTRKAGEKETDGTTGGRVGPPRPGSGPGKEGDITKVIIGRDPEGKRAGEEEGDPIYEVINEQRIVRYLRDTLKLEFIKPGKLLRAEGWSYENLARRGPPSRLSIEHTLKESLLRQILFNPDDELIIGDFEKEDMRFRHPKTKLKKERDAVLIHVRDVSSSITSEELDISYSLSYITSLWLHECYKEVKNIYVLHNAKGWQAKEEDYYRAQPSGGTDFSNAFRVISAMLKGESYERDNGLEQETLYPDEQDIYITDMTDGEDISPSKAIAVLETIIPHVTRFCYLETAMQFLGQMPKQTKQESNFQKAIKGRFQEEVKKGKIRTYNINNVEDIDNALKAFYGQQT